MSNSGTCLAVVDADEHELMLSSSGGAFSILARWILGCGGVVYGHAFDNGLHVGCVRVDDVEGLAVLRGSKYVQSDMGDAMALVKSDLCDGRKVLFSGTPCQVDGLLAFLGGSKDDLLTVDIVCHGVPSPAFFVDCMSWESRGSYLGEIKFRDKGEGWWCGGGTVSIATPFFNRFIMHTRPFSPETSFYYRCFLAGDACRESCYRCPYAGGARPGDFTIGDFWGIDLSTSGINDRYGVSLLIPNTEKARQLTPHVKSEAIWAERPLEEAILGNSQLMHPIPRSAVRDVVLDRWVKQGIDALECEYYRSTALSSMKWRVKRLMKKVLNGVSGR